MLRLMDYGQILARMADRKLVEHFKKLWQHLYLERSLL